MKKPNRFRSTLGTIVAGLAAGALVLAAPQAQVTKVQVPRVQVPTIDAPRILDPRRPIPTERLMTIQMPVMPPDVVAAYVQAARENLSYLPGRVLVKFRSGTRRPGLARVLNAMQSESSPDTLEWIGDVAIVKDKSGADPRQLAERFAREPEVEFAEPDYIQKKHANPNDPSYASRQWNFQLIGVSRAWDLAPGAPGVIIAVVDSGITSIAASNAAVKLWNGSAIVDHSALVGPSPDFSLSRFVLPRDFTVNPAAPGTVVVDTDGHGSHVAGTLGTDTNNSLSLAGIAYNAFIMPLKACVSVWDVQFAWSAAGNTGFVDSDSDGCANSATSAAIRFAADNGAKVLNYSIGGSSPNQTVRNAMAYAVSKGVFIAMSNGNEFNDGNPTMYPAAYAPGLDGAMSVAATTQSDTRANYSTTGQFTEVAAPGGDGGFPVWQMTIRFSDSPLPTSGILPRFDRYLESASVGTSMASPHVAGLAALLVSRGYTNPALIEAIIKASALDLGEPGPDTAFGFGRIQPFFALFGQGVIR